MERIAIVQSQVVWYQAYFIIGLYLFFPNVFWVVVVSADFELLVLRNKTCNFT